MSTFFGSGALFRITWGWGWFPPSRNSSRRVILARGSEQSLISLIGVWRRTKPANKTKFVHQSAREILSVAIGRSAGKRFQTQQQREIYCVCTCPAFSFGSNRRLTHRFIHCKTDHRKIVSDLTKPDSWGIKERPRSSYWCVLLQPPQRLSIDLIIQTKELTCVCAQPCHYLLTTDWLDDLCAAERSYQNCGRSRKTW